MNEIISDLADSVECKHEGGNVSEHYLFHDDDQMYSIVIESRGYWFHIEDTTIFGDELQIGEYGAIDVYNDEQYVTKIHSFEVPDNMLVSMRTIAYDN